jgi:glycosyltransferase involved in cell wall biosynthesis
MRILFATWHRQLIGGAEAYQRTLLSALPSHGHAVALLHEREAAEHTSVLDETAEGTPRWCAASLGQAAALAAARAWRPDVVFVHGLESTDLETTLVEDLPSVLFAHGYYGTCATGTKRFAFPALRPCARAFGAACLVMHYPRRCGGLDPAAMLAEYARQGRRHALLRRYRAVFTASAHMRAEMLRHGVEPARAHALPMPACAVAADPAPPEPRAATGRVALLGRLTREKGGHLLIPALARARAALGRALSLVVAGEGPARSELAAMAQAHGVPATFTGWLGGEALARELRSADLLAVPSVWPEPFGLVGVEAGGIGVPAVGFAVGGIPEWLKPGETGELAPADPPAAPALADAIVRALTDPGHHQRLREGAWRHALRHTVGRHLEALEPALSAAVWGTR